jgi:hypothetical protein
MKRLAVALVALFALAVTSEAGQLPEPAHLVNHMKVYSYTHYVRGAEKGKKHSGGDKVSAEARLTPPAPKQTPPPARAD